MSTQHAMDKERVVLISVVGMSPAVVTESIWGLHQERPELVPDEVVVYTTRLAWENLHKAMFSEQAGTSVWADLQQKVGREITLRKRIFEDNQGGELPDIVTSADQELVADQLLRGIRELKNPQQGECRVVASVAGGSKSMSALMYAAMSLGAAADDMITHVLADETATSCPAFFFPAQQQQELVNRKGEAFTAAKVQIDLAEIPFVPLAALVKNSDFNSSGGFRQLVERARETVASLRPEEIKIRVSKSECKAYINGQELRLGARPYTLMAIMVGASLEMNVDKKKYHLNSTQCIRLLNILKANQWLPLEVIGHIEENEKKAAAPNKQDRSNLAEFYVAAKWKKGFPEGFAKVKAELNAALKDNGFQLVAEDALRRGEIGFQRIYKVGFTD